MNKRLAIIIFVFVFLSIYLSYHKFEKHFLLSSAQTDRSGEVNTSTSEKSDQIVKPKTLFVATSATNLSQWKIGIKGLKDQHLGFQQDWLVEQPGRTNGIPLVLKGKNGEVVFKAVLVGIMAENNSQLVKEAFMQSENMDVGQLRAFGLQICNMIGYDPADFLSWCARVGNNFDANPYFTHGRNPLGFRVLNTFNSQKPWFIELQLQALDKASIN
jgi:hypothetical protein